MNVAQDFSPGRASGLNNLVPEARLSGCAESVLNRPICSTLGLLLHSLIARRNRLDSVGSRPRTLTLFKSGSYAHMRSLKTQCDSMFRKVPHPESGSALTNSLQRRES